MLSTLEALHPAERRGPHQAGEPELPGARVRRLHPGTHRGRGADCPERAEAAADAQEATEDC